MLREAAAWAAFWAAFGVADEAAARRGKSLCATTRWLFRTDTPEGRRAFTIAFAVGATVLHRHVLNTAPKET